MPPFGETVSGGFSGCRNRKIADTAMTSASSAAAAPTRPIRFLRAQMRRGAAAWRGRGAPFARGGTSRTTSCSRFEMRAGFTRGGASLRLAQSEGDEAVALARTPQCLQNAAPAEISPPHFAHKPGRLSGLCSAPHLRQNFAPSDNGCPQFPQMFPIAFLRLVGPSSCRPRSPVRVCFPIIIQHLHVSVQKFAEVGTDARCLWYDGCAVSAAAERDRSRFDGGMQLCGEIGFREFC